MILLNSALQATLYRAHTPRWASMPTSGAGAARQGGRFNRPGIEALYLSLQATTALQEYQQTSPFLPPCTLCAYEVRLNGLVDVRQLSDRTPWNALWQQWRDDWRHARFEQHREPASWVLSDQVRAAGHRGIVFPSLVVAEGVNVVVYNDRLDADNWVRVLDPTHELPSNQRSWQKL